MSNGLKLKKVAKMSEIYLVLVCIRNSFLKNKPKLLLSQTQIMTQDFTMHFCKRIFIVTAKTKILVTLQRWVLYIEQEFFKWQWVLFYIYESARQNNI